MSKKLVVYTAIFGDYDELIDPKENYEGCDFVCFTDQKHLKSSIWEIRLIERYDLKPNMMNRKCKIFPHLFLNEYHWSLYVDANIAIISNPLDLASKYLTEYNIAVPKHFKRDCIYDEAVECIIQGKAGYKETRKQMNYYKNEGMPKSFGLGENNIILRWHDNKIVSKIMNNWWIELNKRTNRDQLSLAYVLWKNGEQFCFMEEAARNASGYFQYLHHKGFLNRTLIARMRSSFRVRVLTIIMPMFYYF